MRVIYLIILVFFVNTLLGQTKQSPFWGSVDLGYGWGLADNGKSFNISRNDIWGKMYLSSIRFKGGYYLNKNLSLGIGFGLNGYHNPGINTFPLFCDVRYHFKKMSRFYTYANIGGSILSNDNFNSGFMSDVGLAFKIIKSRKISLNSSIGYNLFIYSSDWGDGPENRKRHNIFLQLGLEF